MIEWRALLLACITAIPLLAEPQIVAVTTAINYGILPHSGWRTGPPPDITRLSPGSPAIITLSSGLGGAPVIAIGGLPAPIFKRSDESDGTYLYTQIPAELKPGPTAVVVTPANGASLSTTMITLDAYSPTLTDITSERISGISCAPGHTPLSTALFMADGVGLGPTDPAIPTGRPAPSLPLAQTVTKPIVTVDGKPADVVRAFAMPGEIGLYRLEFRLPSTTGWPELAISIGGKTSNTMRLPVGDTIDLRGPAAPDSLQSAIPCGSDLTADVLTGDPRNPPVALGGVRVEVVDRTGESRPAPVLQVAPRSVSYLVPSGTSHGKATVRIIAAGGSTAEVPREIQAVTPQVFVRLGPVLGGIPAAELVRIRDGRQTIEPVLDLDAASSSLIPIDLGPATDQVYLALFATGLRHRSSLANVKVTIGGEAVSVEYAGPQGEFAGLDQLNVRLPRSLEGRGVVALEVKVDEEIANSTTLSFK